MANIPPSTGNLWPDFLLIEDGMAQSGGPFDQATRAGLWNAHGTAAMQRTDTLRHSLGGAVDDLNGLDVTGLYTYAAGSTGAPDGQAGRLQHIEDGIGAFQTVATVTGARLSRTRTGATWSGWERNWSAVDAPAALGPSGYQKLPSGMIYQHGQFSTGTTGNGADGWVSFPIAFPNSCFVVIVSGSIGVISSGTATSEGLQAKEWNTTRFRWVSGWNVRSAYDDPLAYLAIGF